MGVGQSQHSCFSVTPPPHSILTMPSNSFRGLYPHSAESMSVNLGEEKEEPEYNQKTVIQAAWFKSQ